MNQCFSRKTSIIILFFISLALTILVMRLDCGKWEMGRIASFSLCPVACLALVVAHTFLTCFLLLLCGVKSRLFAWVIIPMCLIMWGAYAYTFFFIGPIQYSELVVSTLATNWSEASGYICLSSISCLLIFVAAIALLSFFLQKRCWQFPRWSTIKILSISLIYIVITSALVPICAAFLPEPLIFVLFSSPAGTYKQGAFAIADMRSEVSPQCCYRVLVPLYRQFAAAYHAWEYYRPPFLIPSETLSYEEEFTDDDITVILFIGESYRSDHASWNGYHRETLPKLSDHKDHIINFPYFKSYSTGTTQSVSGILSDATCADRKAKHTSFLGLFDKAGFQNRIILSRTTNIINVPSVYHIVDNKCATSNMCQSTEELVGKVVEAANHQGRKMLVLDDGTGHYPYKHDADFHQFEAKGQGGMEERKAEYDCSLLQVDDTLASIIDALRDKNAVLLYCSDHGHSFGEQGTTMHLGPLSVVSQRHIFAFLWFSDSYREKHAEIIKQIEVNKNKLLSHDDVYLSILSLGGIEVKEELPNCGNFTKELDRPDVSSFSLNVDL